MVELPNGLCYGKIILVDAILQKVANGLLAAQDERGAEEGGRVKWVHIT